MVLVWGTSNSGVALRILGVAPKVGEKGEAPKVGEKGEAPKVGEKATSQLTHPSARPWQ